jgi:hypothetical protein
LKGLSIEILTSASFRLNSMNLIEGSFNRDTHVRII